MQKETEQLLSTFSHFLTFLSTSGPNVLQEKNSKLSTVLQMPQIALAKFNLILKEIHHRDPSVLNEVHKYAKDMQQFESTKEELLVMFIIHSIYPSEVFATNAADIELYKASLVSWLSNVKNQQNVHKLFRYVAMFDELVDHSKCYGFVHIVEEKIEKAEEKIEKTEHKIDEIGLKIIEAVTKPKKGLRGKKASTKKT